MNPQDPTPQPPSQPMQFETAEGVTPGQASCGSCGNPLRDEYHEVCGNAVCQSCRTKAEEAHANDKGWGGFSKALLYGIGAAIACGVAGWAIFKVAALIGIVAIGTGWFVGKAIMRATNERGGRIFQLLAVALTYLAITMSYGANLLEEVFEDNAKRAHQARQPRRSAEPPVSTTDPAQQPLAEPPPPSTEGLSAIGIGTILLIILASPFLGGFRNIIAIAMIAVGLWESWRLTRERPFWTGGPFELGKQTPTPAA